MRQLLHCAMMTLVLFLAATPAHAGSLALDFQGVAAPPSSLDGASLVGDSFTIQADFDTATETPINQGVASYAATSITVTVGGTSYSVTDASDFLVYLEDATTLEYPGLYSAELYQSSLFQAFSPYYTTSSSPFSATDPTPTVFSGYSPPTYFGSLLTFSTDAGFLTLRYNPNVGVDASISSVPEPSSLALCGIGGSIGLVVVASRRRERVA
jgi:hypothetical protein